MKIMVIEFGMQNPTGAPDSQRKVVEFDGNYEEYKELERQELSLPMEGIEMGEIIETEDGTLVVDYISVKMNRKSIRQFHIPLEPEKLEAWN